MFLLEWKINLMVTYDYDFWEVKIEHTDFNRFI